MRLLLIGDSFLQQGGMNQATGEGSDIWIPTTPGATNAAVAGVVTGNGFESVGTYPQSSEWCSLSPNDNEGAVPTLLRGLESNGIITQNNVNIAIGGEGWGSALTRLQDYNTNFPGNTFDAVIIHLGVNPAANLLSQASYSTQIRNLVVELRTNNKPSFILHATCPTTNNDTTLTPVATYEAKVDEINTYLSDLTTEYNNFYTSDVFTALGGHFTPPSVNFKTAPDIHPNSTGSNIIGDTLVTDFITAKAAAESNMAIFGKDGSAVLLPPPAFQAIGNTFKTLTFDSNIVAALTFTSDGSEEVTEGSFLVNNSTGAARDVWFSFYPTTVDGGLRNSPEGEALIGTSNTVSVPVTGGSTILVNLVFDTPIALPAGEIIGALNTNSSPELQIGAASASGSFSYRDNLEAPNPFTGTNAQAVASDPYIWFDTQAINQNPILTTPYSIGTNGNLVSLVDFEGSIGQFEAAGFLDGRADWASLLDTGNILLVRASNATKFYKVTVNKEQRVIALSTGTEIL